MTGPRRCTRRRSTPRDIVLGIMALVRRPGRPWSHPSSRLSSRVRCDQSPLGICGHPGRRPDPDGLRGSDRGLLGDAETPDKFAAIFRFGITPLFLFSGTFFPISTLPRPSRRWPG